MIDYDQALFLVARDQPVTAKDFGQRNGYSDSATRARLDVLTSSGLIEPLKGPNPKRWVLTPAGRDRLRELCTKADEEANMARAQAKSMMTALTKATLHLADNGRWP